MTAFLAKSALAAEVCRNSHCKNPTPRPSPEGSAPRGLPANQKRQRRWKPPRPRLLAMTSSLLHPHPQPFLPQSGSPQNFLKLPHILHDLPILLLPPSLPRPYAQKNPHGGHSRTRRLSRKLPVRNIQRRALRQHPPKYIQCGESTDAGGRSHVHLRRKTLANNEIVSCTLLAGHEWPGSCPLRCCVLCSKVEVLRITGR